MTALLIVYGYVAINAACCLIAAARKERQSIFSRKFWT